MFKEALCSLLSTKSVMVNRYQRGLNPVILESTRKHKKKTKKSTAHKNTPSSVRLSVLWLISPFHVQNIIWDRALQSKSLILDCTSNTSLRRGFEPLLVGLAPENWGFEEAVMSEVLPTQTLDDAVGKGENG